MVSMWKLDYRGKALKLRRGCRDQVMFKIFAYDSDSIEVSVIEKVGNIEVSVEPSHVTVSKGEEKSIKVNIEVSKDAAFEPLWLAKLKFEGKKKSEEGYIGILPVNESSMRSIIREAKVDDRSYAVGAPSVLIFKNMFYLAYRWRNGNEKRGDVLEIARSTDGVKFETLSSFCKERFNYKSFEQAAFVKGLTDKVVFLYCADVDRKWNIFRVEVSDVESIDLPGEVFIENGKDPTAYYDNSLNAYIIVYSNANNPHHDLTVLVTRNFESVEVKANSIIYTQFVDQGNNWARYHIHAGCILKAGKYYVLYYDALSQPPKAFGSGWLGIAISRDLRNWIDLTPEKPLWQGVGIDKTFRYVDLTYDSNNYFFYAEEEVTEKGRKDLVVYYERSS